MKNEQSVGVGGKEQPKLDAPAVKKLTNWDKEPTVMDLKNDLEAARGSHDSHVINVKRWADLRNVSGSAKPKKVTGRSSVQPKLVRRQNEWRYSALSEPFLNTKKLFDVEPVTFEDVEAARQNELVLNWQFRTKINRVRFIDEYVRTCVDEGSVIVRLGWERITTTKIVESPIYRFREIATEEEGLALQEAMVLSMENPLEFEALAPELKEAVAYVDETNIPVVAEISGIEEIEEEVIVRNCPTIQIVDAENIYVDPSCEGEIEKAKFVIVSYETSKAELKKDGRFKNLDAVNWAGNRVLAQADHKTETPDDYELKDDLRRPVVAYEYWGMYDVDGNEELRPIVATWIGDTMIRMEENPFPDELPPFVIVPYLPVKKSVFGEPDAEILEDNQAILGAVVRGMIDLMGRSANAQTGTAKGFLDVTNKRRFEKGMDYEYNPGNGDPRMSVYQHTYPEIPNSALTMMGLQNQEAEALSGVKAFAGGLSGQTYGEVAAGIKGMLDASSKREMNILRRMAKGIIDIGKKVMAMNAIFLSDEEIIRVTNEKFVAIRREDLKGNFDLTVDISTAEVDEAKSNDLGFMLQTMGPDMDPAMSRKILAEIAELKRMPALANDIRNYEPEPDPVQEKYKELELMKLELEVEEIKAQIELKKAQAEKHRADADLKELEFVEQESGTNHARDMERQSAQAQSIQDLEVTKALLRPLGEQETAPDIESAVGYNAITAPGAPLGPPRN